MPNLCQGQIVWIDVPDARGHNCYKRPVVILNRTDEIEAEEMLTGAVASHTASLTNPRPAHFIEVPYHPLGRSRTQLRKPTVVCCDWLVLIPKSDLTAEQVKGRVPASHLELIIKTVSKLNSDLPE